MKKQGRLWSLVLLVLVMVAALSITTLAEEIPNGWHIDGDNTYYYQNGEAVKNIVLEIEGKYYGFNKNGVMIVNNDFKLNGHNYRANEEGVLYTESWFEDEFGGLYYYGADAKAYSDFGKVGDTWYFFDYDGELQADRIVWSNTYNCYYVLSEDGSDSVKLGTNGWHLAFGKYYYVANGEPVCNKVMQIDGAYYAFEADGIMVDDDYCYIGDAYYRARSGGALYANSWYQDSWGDWYYYGADAKALEDFAIVGGVWYFFYEDGMMADDTVVYSSDYAGYYAITKGGANSARLTQLGWNEAFGEWYYLYNNGSGFVPLCGETLWFGETGYYFHYSGKMAKNERVNSVYNEITGVYTDMFAGPTGAFIRDAWGQENGKWVYIQSDYEILEEGLHEIGGNLYIFENGYMYDLAGEYTYYMDDEQYYVAPTGALYRNQWYYDVTCPNRLAGWRYYDNNGRKVRDTLMTIGGVLYAFEDEDGKMLANTAVEYNGEVYSINASGACTPVSGWFREPESGEWMYATGGQLVRSSFLNLGGTFYAFDSDGYMQYNTVCWDDNAETGKNCYYLLDANGHIVKTTGWHKMNGRWYYVGDVTGELATGWLTLTDGLYYLDPAMYNSTMIEVDDGGTQVFYIADNSGRCTKLTGIGFTCVSSGPDWNWTVYVENGIPVRNEWRVLGGNRYFFGDYGKMYSDGVYVIYGDRYMFDSTGRLMTSGWLRTGSGGVYYAQADGTVTCGKATIDGKQYLFNDSGRLYSGGIVEYDGITYYVSDAGEILKDFSEDGWYQVGQDKYLVVDGELARDCLVEIEDDTYGFDRDGRMCHSGIISVGGDYYIFDNNGHVLTGWQKIDGKWYYAEDDGNPTIVQDGYITIEDEDYFFKDGNPVVGTYIRDYEIITTDSRGAITKYTYIPEGWTYTSEGHVIYRPEDGSYYNGWLGDYYISYGRMVFNEVIEYDGKAYYMGAQGLLVKNGWIDSFYYGRLRAKADGSLYCNEWYKSGRNQYYFSYVEMVCDGYEWIDGKCHEFDEDGKWLGEARLDFGITEGLSDGWHYIKGIWKFYHAGLPLTDGAYYINGSYYAFDYDGTMITNAVYEDCYYTDSGARLLTTGWQILDGQWYYFGVDYTVKTGWVRSDGSWYFIECEYDEDYYGNVYTCHLLTNQYFIYGGRLYQAGAGGATGAPIAVDGWYLTAEGWCYILDGQLIVDGYYKIGGVGYYFEDGLMLANTVRYLYDEHSYKPGIRYFNASGAEVTAAGWYMIEGKWIYVDTNGQLLYDGIYKIGNTNYSFDGIFWVG